MLPEAQRQHVVVLKYIFLECVQILALEEHFGDLLLDCVCMPDRDDALADVDGSLMSPLLHLLVLVGCADVAKLVKRGFESASLEEVRKLLQAPSPHWSALQPVEGSKQQ